MFKRNSQSIGTAIQVTVEKKGFKRAEAAIYFGMTPVTIDQLPKRDFLHTRREHCDIQFIPASTSTVFCGKPLERSEK